MLGIWACIWVTPRPHMGMVLFYIGIWLQAELCLHLQSTSPTSNAAFELPSRVACQLWPLCAAFGSRDCRRHRSIEDTCTSQMGMHQNSAFLLVSLSKNLTRVPSKNGLHLAQDPSRTVDQNMSVPTQEPSLASLRQLGQKKRLGKVDAVASQARK